jgi:hypothetical protein
VFKPPESTIPAEFAPDALIEPELLKEFEFPVMLTVSAPLVTIVPELLVALELPINAMPIPLLVAIEPELVIKLEFPNAMIPFPPVPVTLIDPELVILLSPAEE